MSRVLPSLGEPPLSRVGVVLAAVALAMGLVGVGLSITTFEYGHDDSAGVLQIAETVPAWVAASLVGWYLMRHREARAVGASVLITGLAMAGWLLQNGFWYWWYSCSCALPELTMELPAATDETLQLVAMWIPLILLPHVYPDGPAPGRRWRALRWAAVLFFTIAVACRFLQALTPFNEDGLLVLGETVLRDPQGSPYTEESIVGMFLNWALYPLFIVSFLLGLVALIFRWLRGNRLVRRQVGVLMIALVVYAGLFFAIDFRPEFLPQNGAIAVLVQVVWDLIIAGGPVVVVVALAVAVLRYRLYDIRIVVRRVAVYTFLTVAMTVVFVTVYSLVGVLARGYARPGSTWTAAVAGVGVVLCVEPTRRRLQRLLERRYLGDRGEPLRAMARLRERVLEGDERAVVSALVDTVAAAVRSPGVWLGLQRGPQLEHVAATGPTDSDAVVLPLLHHGEQLGEFRVSRRTPGESYGLADRALLQQLADQAAAHVYGLRRDAELTAVRQQALTATLVERSRLGRDLHDGLAPLIAGAGLAAEALRRGMAPGSSDEQEAGTLARRLRAAAGELRRIAHDLQPGPLAEQGLAGAIHDYVAQLTGPDLPRFDVRVSEERLPPAVELVIYRVVLEAVANVVRHARAGRSVVVVTQTDDAVAVEVIDDGQGLHTPYISGVGITSMRSRVEALGGDLQLHDRAEGGTLLRARLPLGP